MLTQSQEPQKVLMIQFRNLRQGYFTVSLQTVQTFWNAALLTCSNILHQLF